MEPGSRTWPTATDLESLVGLGFHSQPHGNPWNCCQEKAMSLTCGCQGERWGEGVVRELGVDRCTLGFPCGSAGKESACNVGDLGSIPGLGRSLGEGKGYPLPQTG